jgi:epoxyqueuosine reductase
VTKAEEFRPRTLPQRKEHQTSDQTVPVAAARDAEEESLFLPRLEWLAGMNEEQFRVAFRGSPIKRTKWRGLVRNACIALGNSAPKPGTPQHARSCTLLSQLAASPEPLISEPARWALSRIQ